LEIMQQFVGVYMIGVPAYRIPEYGSVYIRVLQSLERVRPLVDAIVQRVSDLANAGRIAVVEKPQQYNHNHFHNNIQIFIHESNSRRYYIHEESSSRGPSAVQIRDEEMFDGFFGMLWDAQLSANANVFTPGQQWAPIIRRHTGNRKSAAETLQEMAVQASSLQDTASTVEIEPNIAKRSEGHVEPTASSSVTPAAKRSETDEEPIASTSATPAFAKYIPPHRFRSMTAGYKPSLLSQEVLPSNVVTGPAVHEAKR